MVYPLPYYEFFIKFNEGDYYTCHDLLEEMWLTDRDNLFLKGLLQMCVSLYHYSYGNVKGSRIMMNVAKNYLSKYPTKHWGLDLTFVRNYIADCLSIIPQDIDRVPFEKHGTLPILPTIYLYLEDD